MKINNEMKKRILSLTNIVSPDGENMPLRDAPPYIRNFVMKLILEKDETQGVLQDEKGRQWRFSF